MRSRSLVFFALSLAACAAPSADEDGPSDTVSSDIRYCPKTDPDYPFCTGTTGNGCTGATGSITASASAINLGQSVTVSWNGSLPSTCNGTFMMDGVPAPLTGSKTFTPRSSSNYVLQVDSKRIAIVHVDVNLPATVYINGNTQDWKNLFIQAIGTPNKRVVLAPTLELDLTGYDTLQIANGVTITSEQPPVVYATATALTAKPTAAFAAMDDTAVAGTTGAAAITNVTALTGVTGVIGAFERPPVRDARTLGPRIFTNSRPKTLFNATCYGPGFDSNNIRIVGFRIQGPDMDTMDGDDKLERGLTIDACLGVEIADMEFSGFSGASIYVADSQGRQLGWDNSVKIHDNFIHHNQHVGGNGYGVDLGEGAWSRIEHNVFDNNRHAITSSGKPGTGYFANENLVLAGGGHHDTFFNSYTQLFDVHGDANCPDIPPFDHTWQCGNAGDQYWMKNNAFQYTNDHAIKIRGTPRVQDVFSGNVFTQGDQDGAIEVTQGYTNIIVGANTYGVNTFGEYGVCDFDGDGNDDLFLATGASFWFKAKGKMQWTYLSNYTERLSQVRLGDFNGDHRCDVLAINHGTNNWEISSGGSGPWTPLPGYVSGMPIEQLATGDFNGDHVTDIFRRDPSGQWWAISPNRWGWTALNSSSTPLDHLRFGDFNGDGVTDVLGSNGGKWAISWGGTSGWQNTGSNLNDDLSHVYIGNVDGIAGDDVIRYSTSGLGGGQWSVSSGAHTGWQNLTSFSWPSNINATGVGQFPAAYAHTYIGRFSGGAAADLLVVDGYRIGRVSTVANHALSNYSFWEY